MDEGRIRRRGKERIWRRGRGRIRGNGRGTISRRGRRRIRTRDDEWIKKWGGLGDKKERQVRDKV